MRRDKYNDYHPVAAAARPAARRTRGAELLLVMGWAALVAACSGGDEPAAPVSRQSPVVPLDTGTVFLETEADTFRVSVEIAETATQRGIGLMERLELPDDEGMIFLSYEEKDSTDGFWMFRTRIPLDIAYLDRDGRIVAMRTMEPCTSPIAAYCPEYPPGVRYWGALEVNGGYFAERRIGVGARVTLRRGGRTLTPGDSS